MQSINLEINDSGLIHMWQGANGKLLVSLEDTKTLLSFDTLDDAINSLWLSGRKKAAKQLNEVTE
jgi:hypothetical protein